MSSDNSHSSEREVPQETRKRRKLSKASRTNRRRSSQKLSASPRVSKDVEENAEGGIEIKAEKDSIGHIHKGSNKTLVSLLDEIQEDVVNYENQKWSIPPLPAKRSLNSSPDTGAPTVYVIQTPNGFKSADNSFPGKLFSGPESDSREEQIGRLAKSIQNVWMTISKIAHGFLGGISVTHLILIWATSPENWPLDFILKYASFAEIFGNTFYFLATLCIVSVLDRMDCTGWRCDTHIRTFTWWAIITIYLGTLILSLGCDSIDSRLYIQGGFNLTMNEEEIRLRKLFGVWNNLSIGRSVGGILGWILIGSVDGS